MLLDLLRTHRWLRRALSGLSVLLVLGGVALVGYPFATNMWQGRIQQRLDTQIASPELQQAYKDHKVATGDSLTRIKIPAIGLDTVVVEGHHPQRAAGGRRPLPPDAAPLRPGQRRHRRPPHHLRSPLRQPRPAQAG